MVSGIALFISVSGGFIGFYLYSHISFLTGVSAGFIGIIPGVFFFIIFEGFSILVQILKENKKQTELLAKISSSLDKEQ